jgi:hypothetical protein
VRALASGEKPHGTDHDPLYVTRRNHDTTQGRWTPAVLRVRVLRGRRGTPGNVARGGSWCVPMQSSSMWLSLTDLFSTFLN